VGWGNSNAGARRLLPGAERRLFTAEIVQASGYLLLVLKAVDDRWTMGRAIQRSGARDMIDVPLGVHGKVRGIIYVDIQGRRHEYADREVQLAEAFVGLRALAVRPGWLYRQLGELRRKSEGRE
jgi:GAF domain-containing protein